MKYSIIFQMIFCFKFCFSQISIYDVFSFSIVVDNKFQQIDLNNDNNGIYYLEGRKHEISDDLSFGNGILAFNNQIQIFVFDKRLNESLNFKRTNYYDMCHNFFGGTIFASEEYGPQNGYFSFPLFHMTDNLPDSNDSEVKDSGIDIKISIIHRDDTMNIFINELKHPDCCRKFVLDSIPFHDGNYFLKMRKIFADFYGNELIIARDGSIQFPSEKNLQGFQQFFRVPNFNWELFKIDKTD